MDNRQLTHKSNSTPINGTDTYVDTHKGSDKPVTGAFVSTQNQPAEQSIAEQWDEFKNTRFAKGVANAGKQIVAYGKNNWQQFADSMLSPFQNTAQNAITQKSKHPQSQFLESKAKQLDATAADQQKYVQRNQQIANRDYRRVSEEDAISAGAAAATNAMAQLSGAAGAGAAALAANQAANQAANDAYAQNLAANRSRSDVRSDTAFSQGQTAADTRTGAIDVRQNASALDTNAATEALHRRQSSALSLGNSEDAQSNNTDTDTDVTQTTNTAAIDKNSDTYNIQGNNTGYYPKDLQNGINMAANSTKFYGNDTPERREVATKIAARINSDPAFAAEAERIVRAWRKELTGGENINTTQQRQTFKNITSALTDPNNPTM